MLPLIDVMNEEISPQYKRPSLPILLMAHCVNKPDLVAFDKYLKL